MGSEAGLVRISGKSLRPRPGSCLLFILLFIGVHRWQNCLSRGCEVPLEKAPGPLMNTQMAIPKIGG
jgi:hypothetical protein